MPVGNHALLGASSAHRWLVCPPLARLEEKIKDRGSSFAEEGTAAHELAELQRVDFTKWVPEGFGTSDVVVLSDKTIEIIDLKYGKGVPVDAYLNPQLMLYALGAVDKYDIIYEFETVRMTIIQPRLDNISTFE
ncbi:DUF2800 domain-containing protein, partial [Klebsiella pneumoniae]